MGTEVVACFALWPFSFGVILALAGLGLGPSARCAAGQQALGCHLVGTVETLP